MAHIVEPFVIDSSTSTGLGNFTVAATPPKGCRTLDDVLGIGDTFDYAIQHTGLGTLVDPGSYDAEEGIATYLGGGVFARTVVVKSTNADAAVNFAAGTKSVQLVHPSFELVLPDVGRNTSLQFLGTDERPLLMELGDASLEYALGRAGNTHTWSGREALSYHVNTGDSHQWFSSGWEKLMELTGGAGDLRVKGLAQFGSLDTDGAAPTPSGTTKFVITDDTGTLSFVDAPSAGAGGSDTEIQYNNLGVLDGDPDFTWVAGSGLTNLQHAAIGNYAGIDAPVWAPGDPGDVFTIPNPAAALVISEYMSGALPNASYLSGLDVHNNFENTGLSSPTIAAGIVCETHLSTLSTGTVNNFNGMYGGAYSASAGNVSTVAGLAYTGQHYGTGNVSNLSGADIYAYDYGSSDVTNVRGLNVYVGGEPTSNNDLVAVVDIGGVIGPFGTVTDMYGLRIADMSGIGSSESLNIKSIGGGNLFTGHAAIGNFAEIGTLTYAPGDPINTTPFNILTALAVNDFTSGDLSAFDEVAAMVVFPTFSHTGASPASSLLLDFQPVISSDSTGDWGSIAGIYIGPYNVGSGDIADFRLADLVFFHDGAGEIAILRGLNVNASCSGDVGDYTAIQLSTPTLSSADNVYGLRVRDHSGIGSTDSLNIFSEGASSLNVFEGILRLGTGTNASPTDGDLWFDGTNLKFRHGGVTTNIV